MFSGQSVVLALASPSALFNAFIVTRRRLNAALDESNCQLDECKSKCAGWTGLPGTKSMAGFFQQRPDCTVVGKYTPCDAVAIQHPNLAHPLHNFMLHSSNVTHWTQSTYGSTDKRVASVAVLEASQSQASHGGGRKKDAVFFVLVPD